VRTFRVEQLAAACGVSVDTVRYYQSRDLLPPPRREGRIAVYDEEHAVRLREIRALQAKGLSLAVIARALRGDLDRADRDLAAAVAAARGESEETITLEELAERSGAPLGLLRAVEPEALRLSRRVDGEDRYTASDVEFVRLAMRLLQTGLPLDELLDLAKDHHAAVAALAERAVDLFDRHVREPLREGEGADAAGERVVEAFGELLPAVTALVAHHFRRVLLSAAEERLERPAPEPAPASARRRRSPAAS
jgi:DNA-binding transcriptional MerR regulator